jgi:charged multivesicular body protein 2A
VITVNDTPQSEGEEEETEELVNQVLDEIGITLDTQMVKAPAGGVAMTAAAAAAPAAPMAEAAGAASDTGLDTDLQDRLNNLRR